MTSVAARKRAKRTSRKIAPVTSRAKPSLVVDNAAKAQPPREAGLDWLLARGRIARPLYNAGLTWGADYRLCLVDGLEPLRSCLDQTPGGGSGTVPISYAVAQVEAQARRTAAIVALCQQPDMIAALDAICGRQLTPWELARESGKGKQREVEEVQTTLRLALDLLVRHYRLTR